MSTIEYPFKLLPSPYGTKLSLSGGEDGIGFTVELNVADPTNREEKRARLLFGGFVQARINTDVEIRKQSQYALGKISKSLWAAEFLESYVKNFGPALLSAVKNVEHFFVIGHDFTVELLARKVEVFFENTAA